MISEPNFVKGNDFLTSLLLDDMFKDDIEMVLDECFTFMLAANLATIDLIDSALYFVTALPEVKAKLVADIAQHVKKCGYNSQEEIKWTDVLQFDKLDNF